MVLYGEHGYPDLLTEEQRRRINEIAQADGLTMAAVVRRALDAYLTADHDRRLRSQRRSVPIPMPRPQVGTSGAVADLLVDTDVFIDHLRGATSGGQESTASTTP